MGKTLALEELGPVLSLEQMIEVAADNGISLPEEVAQFLQEHGNGGYLSREISLQTGQRECPTFVLQAVRGINHQRAEISLLPFMSAAHFDEVLPEGVVPVIRGSGGTCLCWTTPAVSGCNIVYWSAFDGEPDQLVPVAKDFDDLLSRLGGDQH